MSHYSFIIGGSFRKIQKTTTSFFGKIPKVTTLSKFVILSCKNKQIAQGFSRFFREHFSFFRFFCNFHTLNIQKY